MSTRFHPRPYLSWSQLNLYEKDPEDYRQTYILGQPRPPNEPMQLGLQFATEMETRKGQLFEYARIWLPTYPKREYTLEVTCDACPLLAKLDGYDPQQRHIGEYKTGKLWSQRRVDQDGQLTFYAYVHYLKFNTIPAQIALHWVQTGRNADDELTITGKLETFYTTRKMEDFLDIHGRIKRAWEGIGKMAEEEWSHVA
jgi:hypothetical protein